MGMDIYDGHALPHYFWRLKEPSCRHETTCDTFTDVLMAGEIAKAD
jgi:hypothetical protein